MFPSTMPIVDALSGPTGPMNTGNWGADVGDPAMTIAAGGGALASTDAVSCTSIWTTSLAIVRSAFVTVAVLPAAGGFCTVGATSDAFLNNELYAVLTMSTTKLTIVTQAGSVASAAIPGLANGDSIGMSYDPTTDIATAWYRVVGASTWTSMATKVSGNALLAPTGWRPFVASNDGVTVRLRNFGAEQFAGSDITAPVVHGHGAC